MLRFSPDANEDTLREVILECGRIACEPHLLTANEGKCFRIVQ